MPDDRHAVLLVLAASSGGIGRHVKALADGLPALGFRVTVCAPAPTIAGLRLDALDARVVAAPVGALGPLALRETRRVLRREAASADVTHSHGLRAGADCAAFALGRPLVVTWHNAALGGGLRRRTHGVLARYVARSSDLTLAASDDLLADAKAAGARRVQGMFVAAPALPPPHRSRTDVRAELGVGDRPLVLAVGRLHHQKRFDVLVEAATSWAGDDDLPFVVIAGDGPDRDRLAAQIAASSAPVTLLGARDDVAELLHAADVVTLPSEWEARALVAQEALRAGVPLVTTDVGGLAELVGDAAIVVPVGDAVALRRAIERVLTDPGERDRLVGAGRRQAEGWPDEAANVTQVAQCYLDLIASGGA